MFVHTMFGNWIDAYGDAGYTKILFYGVGTAVLGVIAAVWAIAQAKKVAKRNAAAANAATACFNIVDFAPRTVQIILIVICRDMRVTNYSSRSARVAAALRAARHEAECIFKIKWKAWQKPRLPFKVS